MSLPFGSIGAGPGAGLRFARTRGRSIDGTQIGLRYPNPFFDIAQTYLPTSVRTLFKWCKFFFLTHPIIHTVIAKMAEYPITELSYDTDKDELKEKWRNVLEEVLDILSFLVSAGLDFFCFGNVFVSMSLPFRKYLKCSQCGHEVLISETDYKFRDFQYLFACPKCNIQAAALIVDKFIRSLKGLRLIRWSAENVTPSHNPVTGESIYVYDMPQTMKNDILIGKKEIIERVPHVFIEALRLNKAIELHNENFYHMKRPGLAEQSPDDLGIPLPFPVLKSAFYLQILQKSQEAIAQEHIVPLRILFPQPSTTTGDPYVTTNLENWVGRVEEEISKWRFDQNHIPIMPLPIGHQSIGGDGRALLLHQEIRIWSEHIVAGMGVPLEFVFGGLSWSGSNVSLRMLENTFLNYRKQQLKLVKWVMKRIATFMDWPLIDIHFTDFKMADDLQKKTLLTQLVSLGKLSDDTLMEELNLDARAEKEQIDSQIKSDAERKKKQMIAEAEAQGEASLVAARYQKKLLEQQSETMTGEAESPLVKGQGTNVDARGVAQSYAAQIQQMPPEQQKKVMQQIQKRWPNLANMIAQLMSAAPPPQQEAPGQQAQAPQGSQPANVKMAPGAMKPLPAKNPPRRQDAVI